MSTAKAAPSEVCEEFPAVTLPCKAKAGLSLDMTSREASARMPSSFSTQIPAVFSPRLPHTLPAQERESLPFDIYFLAKPSPPFGERSRQKRPALRAKCQTVLRPLRQSVPCCYNTWDAWWQWHN